MKKQFKYSCYVDISGLSKEERLILMSWIKKIGGELWIGSYEDSFDFIAFAYGKFSCVIRKNYKWTQEERLKMSEYINCGSNIELFKAIAAINYTDDYMQIFYSEETKIFYKCVQNIIGSHFNIMNYRKATISELVQYFGEEYRE